MKYPKKKIDVLMLLLDSVPVYTSSDFVHSSFGKRRCFIDKSSARFILKFLWLIWSVGRRRSASLTSGSSSIMRSSRQRPKLCRRLS